MLNATLGNLTELVIAFTALRAGMLDLVQASIAGAIMTNSLFMLGMALLLGGPRHHVQVYNRVTARLQSGMLFRAAIAMLVPSAIGSVEHPGGEPFRLQLSIGLSVVQLVAYALGMLFSLRTHKEVFASVARAGTNDEPVWPVRIAGALLVVVTVVIALFVAPVGRPGLSV